ncbi:MAG: tRNA (N(6)-L-threonylcarbamoyladenosine(37)-C(2))-methylthiotransferase MtaB [bacterium]|nr:tRNA (N(6)-L-threonylcarbamoyladenosine(37)-C(2))-methylthiotransferase MtaB [bacterium]
MRAAFTSLGCRSNHFDMVAMINRLRDRGAEIVSFTTAADLYLVNTCTVTAQADFQSRQLLRRARKRNPRARVIAIGCGPQRDPKGYAALPDVDLVLGNPEKTEIAEIVQDYRPAESGAPLVRVSPIAGEKRVLNFGVWPDFGRTRTELKIQEGCGQGCSYCVIPETRGAPRSVSPEESLDAVGELEKLGYREVVLTGTQLTAYGREYQTSLSSWLKNVFRETRKTRIRLSSLEPWRVDDQLAEMARDRNRLCPHFHLALQSLDDDILKEMNRPGDSCRMAALVRDLAGKNPELAVGTDLISGFPGETEESFARTYSILEGLPLAYLHVFPYSPRPGTKASALKKCAPEREIKRRVLALRELSRKKRGDYYERFLGQWLEVIPEEPGAGEKDAFRGMSSNYIPVHFPLDPTPGPAAGLYRVKAEKILPGRIPHLWGSQVEKIIE